VTGDPCDLDENWLGWHGFDPTGIACGKPSVATLTLVCLHEHIDTVRVCAECGADVQTAGSLCQITCKRCWGDHFQDSGHACWMQVSFNWDSGGHTVAQTAGGFR
jgi:hypothetical protein